MAPRGEEISIWILSGKIEGGETGLESLYDNGAENNKGSVWGIQDRGLNGRLNLGRNALSEHLDCSAFCLLRTPSCIALPLISPC